MTAGWATGRCIFCAAIPPSRQSDRRGHTADGWRSDSWTRNLCSDHRDRTHRRLARWVTAVGPAFSKIDVNAIRLARNRRHFHSYSELVSLTEFATEDDIRAAIASPAFRVRSSGGRKASRAVKRKQHGLSLSPAEHADLRLRLAPAHGGPLATDRQLSQALRAPGWLAVSVVDLLEVPAEFLPDCVNSVLASHKKTE